MAFRDFFEPASEIMSHRHIPITWTALFILCGGTALRAQDFPRISQRQYVDGSVKLVVTGAFAINEDVAINKPASFSDGESTWLQFGASGSEKANVLITYGETKEIGITIGRGKLHATGGITPGQKSDCSGTAEVTAKLISGKYTCHGITSYDPGTGKMSTVDIEVTFTAKS